MSVGQVESGNVVGLPGGGNLRLAGNQVDPAAVREIVDGEVSDGGEDVFFDEKLTQRPRDRSRESDDPPQVFGRRWPHALQLFLPREAGRFFWKDELHRA
jgi:hypothetical protein